MFRRTFVALSAAAMVFTGAVPVGLAYSPEPKVSIEASEPAASALPEGSYQVAGRAGRNFAIGLGVGALAVGAAAAAANARNRAIEEEYEDSVSCRRVERRCAREFGWDTRRFDRCVYRAGC